MITIPNEALLSLNKFGNPKVVSGNEATYYLLTRLILLEKGTIQSHPDMGVGIVSRYRYAFENAYKDLQYDIQEQIGVYLPQLAGVDVKVSCMDKVFKIEITVDGSLYSYNFNTDKATLETIRTT